MTASLPTAAPPAHPALRRLARLALASAPLDELLDALVAEAATALGADARLHPAAGELPSHVADVVATGRTSSFDERTLLVPVGREDRVRHVLVLTAPEPRGWTETDADLAEALAEQAALGLAAADAEENVAIRHQALARAAGALNVTLDPVDILRELAREAVLALGADVAEVYLVDEVSGCGVATAGHNTADGWEASRIAPGDGVAGRALATGRPAGGHTSAPELAVPMRWDGRVRGALGVRWTAAQQVGDGLLHALTAIGELAVAACRNAEAYQLARTAASTDALTGLLNHGALQLRLREEIARAARDGHPLTCVLIDLDDFKRVNDELGHLAGDELLREVAAALRAELRTYDCAARYGGDEFVLILPGTAETAARAVADRVRDNLRAAGERAGRQPARCSVGIAGWAAGMDADGLLAQADRGLLLAKRTGKGRTAIASLDTDAELERLTASDSEPVAVQALAAAIEARDGYFQGHSEEVVSLATRVAMLMGLPAPAVERIGHAALLHDVGKLAVPPGILGKDGALDEAEWEIMAAHPVLGEQILLRLPQLAALAPIVRHEHEHWDGSGYPDGLRGARIPLGSRIILACDAYAAMTTPRPYRPALTRAAACDELRAAAGTQFDPDVVDALLDVLGA